MQQPRRVQGEGTPCWKPGGPARDHGGGTGPDSRSYLFWKHYGHTKDLERNNMPSRSREQQLIDLMFELLIRAHYGNRGQTSFHTRGGAKVTYLTADDLAKVIRHSLAEAGFPCEPMGLSYGVLQQQQQKETSNGTAR